MILAVYEIQTKMANSAFLAEAMVRISHRISATSEHRVRLMNLAFGAQSPVLAPQWLVFQKQFYPFRKIHSGHFFCLFLDPLGWSSWTLPLWLCSSLQLAHLLSPPLGVLSPLPLVNSIRVQRLSVLMLPVGFLLLPNSMSTRNLNVFCYSFCQCNHGMRSSDISLSVVLSAVSSQQV